MTDRILTQARLKELLHYNPETGVFTWKQSPCNRVMVGAIAGSLNKGYRIVGIDGLHHSGHRLAWMYTYGCFPYDEIDHINGDRDDNRIVNLRISTRQENAKNIGKKRNNTSGFNGVAWAKTPQKWVAHITIDKKLIHLGIFKTHLAACYARHQANINHNFSPRHGL